MSLTPAPGEHQGQIPKAGSRPLPRQAPAQQDARGRELQLQVSVDSIDSVDNVDNVDSVDSLDSVDSVYSVDGVDCVDS